MAVKILSSPKKCCSVATGLALSFCFKKASSQLINIIFSIAVALHEL